MSLPAMTLHGRVVQAAAFRNDLKGRGVDGIVQLEVKVERDGSISKVKFLSGEAVLLDDAKEYLRNAQFPALPNDPRLTNAERKWKLEVAFFAPPK
jgi:outer membrane biosynthesis protein TonB